MVLGLERQRATAALARLAAALVLAVGLAAPVLVLVGSQVAGSARGKGFTLEVVLAHSVHPFALVQTVVGSLFGNPANLANEWWGQNFFPRGFPYVLSLYLGAVTLALAATGLLERKRPAGRLLLLLGVGIVLSLGRYGGLAPLIAEPEALRVVRFPVKAFFTVHLAVALSSALGLAALAEGRALGRYASAAATLGAALVGSLLLPLAAPEPMRALRERLSSRPASRRLHARLSSSGCSATRRSGGRSRCSPRCRRARRPSRARAAGACGLAAVAAVLAVDLLRVGAGLNPMVSPGFFEPSAELAERLSALREGRVYTCPIESSPAYLDGLAAHGGATRPGASGCCSRR